MHKWLLAGVAAPAAWFLVMTGVAHTQPVPLIVASLDASVVTTGGSAVTALQHYHRLKGGWLQNPSTATTNLCINEKDAETAAPNSGGDTTCIVPGQTYILAPSGNSVSVVASDSGHVFSGYGWQ
jgi:hypothetical protein